MIRTNLEHSNHLRNIYNQDKNQKAKVEKSEKKEEVNKSESRVSQIKEQIQNGQYRVDLKKTSEKMALNLLNL